MAIFFRPFFPALLVLIVVLSAIAGGQSNGLEAGLMAQMAEARGSMPQLIHVATVLTELGSAAATLGVAAAAALWLLLNRAPGRAFLLATTVVVVRLLVDGLKELIGRPRPPLDWLPNSMAFPSGHSANSMTAFLATALIVCPRAYRPAAIAFGLATSLIVGLTRVVLGVHWPSDVVGGWALGLLAVTIALIAGQRSGLLSLEAQHEIVGRHRLATNEDEPA